MIKTVRFIHPLEREEGKQFKLTPAEEATLISLSPAEAWSVAVENSYPNESFALDCQYWTAGDIVAKLRSWKRKNRINNLQYLIFIKGALWYRVHKICQN